MQNRLTFDQVKKQYKKEVENIYFQRARIAWQLHGELRGISPRGLCQKFLKSDYQYLEVIYKATDGFSSVPTDEGLENIRNAPKSFKKIKGKNIFPQKWKF
jgi:hypothetical protein